MTTRNIPIGVYVRPEQYRALTRIATDKGVQVHTLIEHLVARALHPGRASRPIVECTLHGQALTDEIRKLHADGYTDRAIANAVGLERDIVCQRRIALKLPLNPDRPRHPAADPDKVRQLHAEGLTDNRIADRLGTTAARVQRVRADVLHLPTNTHRGRKKAPERTS